MRTQEYRLIFDYGRHIINIAFTIYYIIYNILIAAVWGLICKITFYSNKKRQPFIGYVLFYFSFYFSFYGSTINYLHIARTLGTNKRAYVINPVVQLRFILVNINISVQYYLIAANTFLCG